MQRLLVGSALIALALVRANQARVDDFPSDLVRWRPSPEAPVFRGEGSDAWDKKIRERGWILRDGDTYHLWYTGYNDAKAKEKLLGHATSKDGVNWTRDPANPLLPGDWVEDVCVVKADDGYWIFAEGEGDIAHLLTSPDGKAWTERGPLDIRKADSSPITPGPRGTPAVWVEGGVWYLFYERGDQGVWLATSKDRKVWTNLQDDPVLTLGPGAYDRAAVAFNQVFQRDGIYYAVYHANSERPWKEWTTCLARSRDLVHWEKYPGNPIVGNNCSSGIVVNTPEGPRLYTMHPEVRRFEPASKTQR
jgi:sucrose-6-phosphate hydrolase SacC (GH32 family)